MPRPRKWRTICALPDHNEFGPKKGNDVSGQVIIMTIDEYETIRLIDYEGLNQEECAKQMNVARTTAQRIYINAKKKLATSIVEGCMLKIEGGEYKLCEGKSHFGRCGRCRKHGFDD